MAESAPAYEAERRDGVLRISRPDTEWLSTGWNGGRTGADCTYNISVPEGWNCDDLAPYVDARLADAGYPRDEAPVLLTGVDLEHARGAHHDSVTVYATAGVSNPAALPMKPSGERDRHRLEESSSGQSDTTAPPGTVNLVVGTTRALEAGALENLLAVAAEAKAATLLTRTGFPGTTTDAIVVGHDPAGQSRPFSGSATDVGAATRACVREAVTAALTSRYETTDATVPESVSAATYGVSTDARATVFRL
ncbi:adenosylcobinamide amidohydrolase [Natronosalvus vescus]|uniref:adenosylcobinamide amidohydrolase n=1 Tax=Natronosalvus vescus TaxID=2953881 RepID=UPI00208FFEE0|nr:adenosylcobinamide amidohydrolase [Natronosalvus vescus]